MLNIWRMGESVAKKHDYRWLTFHAELIRCALANLMFSARTEALDLSMLAR
jgi:hypothetical protein